MSLVMRRSRTVAAGGGGGRSGLPGGKGAKIGIPGLIIVVVGFLISQAGGGGGGSGLDQVLGQLTAGQGGVSGSVPPAANTSLDAQEQFAKRVTILLNQYWEPTFAASDQAFRPPTVVVFDGPTQTGGCGTGTPEAGPFYCPGDEKIYIDFTFYERLERQLGFDGDFALAYVLAHEYGHHVQNQLGIDAKVRQESQGASQAEANALSVKLELQADCFAGLWGRSAFEQDRLEAGDFDEAIDAASAVGDDAIQGAGADRETFTHGSSAERQKWFRTGYDSADPRPLRHLLLTFVGEPNPRFADELERTRCARPLPLGEAAEPPHRGCKGAPQAPPPYDPPGFARNRQDTSPSSNSFARNRLGRHLSAAGSGFSDRVSGHG